MAMDPPLDENAQHVLRQFVEIAYDHVVRDLKRKKKLEKSPNGYYMNDESGVFSCFICHRNFEAKDIWYDKYGYKCRDCYNNVLRRVISKTLSKKRDSWCSDWKVTKVLAIHPATRDKLVRQGKLRARFLKDSSGGVYERIFIKSENPLLSEKN